MTNKRRSVDPQTFANVFEWCARNDMRFGQFIVNALTTMSAASRTDFQGLLWNVENEDLEREMNRFIEAHPPDQDV